MSNRSRRSKRRGGELDEKKEKEEVKKGGKQNSEEGKNQGKTEEECEKVTVGKNKIKERSEKVKAKRNGNTDV